MDWASSGEEPPSSWKDLFSVNLIPSELFLKFRKETQGLRAGVNLELYNAPCNDYQAKLVLKPLAPDRRWKFVYEPICQNVRIISKKIPVTNFLNLQVGISHNFQMNAIGWKWKLTTCHGADGISRIRNKTSVGLCPGIDFRFGWRVDYVLPEMTGGLGSDEPLMSMNSGKLFASLDRIETILTHSDAYYCFSEEGEGGTVQKSRKFKRQEALTANNASTSFCDLYLLAHAEGLFAFVFPNWFIGEESGSRKCASESTKCVF